MKELNANSLLPQHSLSVDQENDIFIDIKRWLYLQGVHSKKAVDLSTNLISLAYRRRLELNSDEPIVAHLTQLAKEIALDLNEHGKLFDLLTKSDNSMDVKEDRQWYGMVQVDTDLYAGTESDDIVIVKDVFPLTTVESNDIVSRLRSYFMSLLNHFKQEDQL